MTLGLFDKRNVTLSMEMSFFPACPITGGLSVPAQTLRTSNESMSTSVFVRVSFDFAHGPEPAEGLIEWRWFEPVCRLVLVETCWKKRHLHAFLCVVSQEKEGINGLGH